MSMRNKIKVVELSHKSPRFLSQMGLAKKPNSPVSSGSPAVQGKPPTERNLENFKRLSAFIDSMFQKRDKSNPVKAKTRGPEMKKHTAWNKVLNGLDKCQTPAHARKLGFSRLNSPLRAHPEAIQSGEFSEREFVFS